MYAPPPPDCLKCRQRLFKYWFFSLKHLVSYAEKLPSSDKRSKGTWIGVQPTDPCGSGQVFSHRFADVSVKKRLPYTSYTSLHINRQLMLAGSWEHLDWFFPEAHSSPPTSALTPPVWVYQWHQWRPNGRDISIDTGSTQPSLVEKSESRAAEHGLSDEFGVLGQDQVSTEMGFNTVSRHEGEEKKPTSGWKWIPSVDAAVDSGSIMLQRLWSETLSANESKW